MNTMHRWLRLALVFCLAVAWAFDIPTVSAINASADEPEAPIDLAPPAEAAFAPLLTVGTPPCTYSSIGEAMAAAASGDTLLLEGGVTFTAHLSITKDLTIQGGYNGCGSGLTDRTTLDGSSSGRVIYINEGTTVTLENLIITHGQTTGNGAGIFVGSDAEVTGNNLYITNNTALAGGGGVRLAGGRATFTDTNIYNNTAAEGAGVHGGPFGDFGPVLNLSSNVDVYNNHALTGNGFGGAVYMSEGTVSIADCSDIYSNEAIRGGGMYLVDATMSMTGECSEIQLNTASDSGGGIYAQTSTINLGVDAQLTSNQANYGGGVYLADDNTVTLYASQVVYNTAQTAGGGIHLNGTNILNISNGSVLSNNRATAGEGGAITAAGTPDINISNSSLESNTAGTNGGAVHLSGGTLDFSGWWALSENVAAGNGGAIAITGTGNAGLRATTAGSSIISNYADGNGGALYLNNNSTLELQATQGYLLSLSGNTAGANGGAAYADDGGTFDVYGQVVVTANRVAAGNGGAFYLSNNAKIWLDDNFGTSPEVRVNWAQNGGAIYAQNNSQVECDGARVGYASGGNYTTSGAGGAIYLSASTYTGENCVFFNNQAETHGGAIAAFDSTVTINERYLSPTNAREREAGQAPVDAPAVAATGCDPLGRECSSFYGNVGDSDENSSGDGGAIYASNSTLTVRHTYLHHNKAARGGAIYQEGASAAAQVSDSLIHHNTVTLALGAGIRATGGAFTLRQVTIADNIGGAGYSSEAAVNTSASNTIAWGNASSGFTENPDTATCNIDQSGRAGPAADPKFNNPGSGEDYHLGAGSPAMDGCISGTATDLEGRARPFGPGYDMGAYEADYRMYLPEVSKQ